MRQNGQNKFLTVAGPQIYWNLCQYNLAQFARSGCIPRFQDLLDERTKDPSQVDNTDNTCCTWGCLASRWWKEGTSDPWHFHTLTHSTWDCYLSTPESNNKSNDPLLETLDYPGSISLSVSILGPGLYIMVNVTVIVVIFSKCCKNISPTPSHLLPHSAVQCKLFFFSGKVSNQHSSPILFSTIIFNL